MLAVVIVVTLLARRAVASPALARLRVLLPAWRFFDRAVASPRLWVRAGGTWRPLAVPPRGPWGWAFAPRANFALACQAAVDQLVAELGELAVADGDDGDPVVIDPAVTGLASYQRVTQIARAQAGGGRFAWKIVVPGPADYLQSPELV